MKFSKFLVAVVISFSYAASNGQKLNVDHITEYVDSVVKDISQKHPLASVAVAIF